MLKEWLAIFKKDTLMDHAYQRSYLMPGYYAGNMKPIYSASKRINAHLRNITTSVINPFDRIGFEPKKQ